MRRQPLKDGARAISFREFLGLIHGEKAERSTDVFVIKARSTRIKYLIKMTFASIYWFSLRYIPNPVLDIYLKLTAPKPNL